MADAPGPSPAGGQPLPSPLDQIQAEDGATVDPEVIPVALTAGSMLFEDGATQVLNADGTPTCTERGRPPGRRSSDQVIANIQAAARELIASVV